MSYLSSENSIFGITPTSVLSTNNQWLGTNAFNVTLPTSNLTPSSSNQLITKAYGDLTYSSTNLITSNNQWLGTNAFNVTLPTSNLTPSSSNQLITKAYGDATYISGSNTTVYTSNSTITIVNSGVYQFICIGSGGAKGADYVVAGTTNTGGSGGGGGGIIISLYLTTGQTLSVTAGLNSNTTLTYTNGYFSGTQIIISAVGGAGGGASNVSGGTAGTAGNSSITGAIQGALFAYGTAGSAGNVGSTFPLSTGYNILTGGKSYGIGGGGGVSQTTGAIIMAYLG